MKIGRGPSEPTDYNKGVSSSKASSSLMQTRDKVRKVTRKIPHAFTAGKVHFSKLQANKASKKASRLFAQTMNTLDR